MRTFLLSIIAAALLLAPATLNASTIVYDNGAINGSINAWSIATNLAGWEVSDSFTLSATATLTSADVGLWVSAGDTPSSLTWSIGTSFFDTSLGTGTETPGNTYWGVGFDYYPIYDSTFSLPSITLGPGTYYLNLSGMTAEAQNIYWDETDGPSSAYELNYGAIGSESFRLYTGGSTVPEPASFGLIGMGLLGMAAVLRRRIVR
jgi:hypothetical protein